MLDRLLRFRTLLLLVFFVDVNSLEEVNNDEEDFFRVKCPRSRLEQDMWVYKKQGSLNYLPRLRDLKKLYPGDRFTPSRENMCRDHGVMCPLLAQMGHCTGSDWNVSFN